MRGPHGKAGNAAARRFRRFRAGRRPQRILDLGCGDGATEVHLEAAFPRARIDGVDVSAESVKVAGERGLSRCDFRTFDGRRIPFADGSFDSSRSTGAKPTAFSTR